MKKLFFSIILISLTSLVIGQWQWKNPYPTSNNLYSVTAVSEDIWFTVGENGCVLKTEDGGNTWIYLPIDTISESVNDVFFINEEKGWIVSSRIFFTEDGGENWVIQNNSGGQTIQFINESTGWASGNSLLFTDDGGNNWNSIYSVGPGYFTDIYFMDQNYGWALKYEETFVGTILKTTDGGNTWTEQYSSGVFFNSVFFIDNSIGWTTCESGGIYKTIDGGNNWAVVSTIGSSANDIIFYDSMEGWVVSSSGEVFHSTDGGFNWYLQNGIGDIQLNSIALFDNENLITVGDRGTVITTNDGGTLWQVQSSDFTALDFRSVFFIDENLGWVCGQQSSIFKSDDGGTTWTLKHQLSADWINDIYFIDENNGWAVGPGSNQIFNTSNGGDDWEIQTVGEYCYLQSVYFHDLLNGIAVGGYNEGIILNTSDGGINWNVTANYSSSLKDIYFINAQEGWISGQGIALHTLDGGNNWELVNVPTSGYGVCFTDEFNGWIVGAWVRHTSDGGNTWVIQDVPSFAAHDVFFTDQTNGWLVTGNQGSGLDYKGNICYTINGGDSWFKYFSEIPSAMEKIYFINENVGWAVGSNGNILKIENGTVVSVDEISNYQRKELVINSFPNPFTNTINVEFELVNDSYVLLKLLNPLGQEIAIIYNGTKAKGVQHASLSTSAFPTGLYIIQLQAGNTMHFQKIIKN